MRMMMNKLGTLVLFDMENLKTPIRNISKDYSLPKIDALLIKEALQKTIFDTHYHFVAFVKNYRTVDKRYQKNIKFIDFLKSQGFEVISKIVSTSINRVKIKGQNKIYSYEECDMDAEIVHTIHSIGKYYSRIILFSGDSDMKSSLDYVAEEHNTEIVIVSHKEHLSNKYKDYRCIYLHELMDDRYVHKQKDQ